MRLTLAALAIALAAPPLAAAPPNQFSLGVNLSGVTDYSTEPVFVDLFKAARAWVSNAEGKPWGQGGPLALDAAGNVKALADGQYADAIVFTNVKEVTAGGTYLCLYEGDGHIDFKQGARVTKREAGRLTVEIAKGADTLQLRLSKTDPTNPVRKIRLIPADREKDHLDKPFRDDFLARWKGFGTLRFMDWMRTNGSKVAAWSERPVPSDHSQALKGVAVEYMVQLANDLGADPWFCMPHLATDEYVREFARHVKKHLEPGRQVYVEYSNECWNGQFEQARYCREQGKKLGLSKNDYEAQLRYFSRRSVEMFAIWEKEFGTKGLVRVLASQSVNPWTGQQVMDWEGAAKKADAIAIAPYFGGKWGDPKTRAEVAKMTPEALAKALAADVADSAKSVRTYAAEAKKRGVALIAYEAGQHLVGHGGAENDEALTKLLIETNRRPEMRGLYLDYLRGWQKAGGGVCCIFSSVSRPSKWGSWGLLEHAAQNPADAPKFQAVAEILKESAKR